MVTERSSTLDRVFQALAHPARRAIIRRLAGGEQNLSALAAPLKMSFPAASKHVRVLERAKLVRRRVSGRQHLCRLEAAPLKEVTQWTEQFRAHWEPRFQVLDALLAQMKSDVPLSAPPPGPAPLPLAGQTPAVPRTRVARIRSGASRHVSGDQP